MYLSEYTIKALRQIISGDDPLTERKQGYELVNFFNSFGAKDTYERGVGLPNQVSRNQYVVDKLTEFNGSKVISDVILTFTDERFYAEVKNPDIGAVIEKIKGIIKHDGYILDNSSGIYKVVKKEFSDDEVKIDPHFEDIEKQILETLNQAKFIIWVTVAWFTNKKLFDKLIEKKNEGINVQLIISDDKLNTLDYESHFETKKFQKMGDNKNIMHNKFCIIDLNTVIHGSYNWTNKGNYNKETISIEKSKKNAEKYAIEFMKLKR